MSTQVDERVVSMQFDNKNFEQNVRTSMSTLDKLKAKLNLSGAAKGLENVNKAAKNTNMSGLASGVETVRAKFSALEVIGVTALANITNSAVNAGKKLASALTVEPVMDGFREYEMTLNAVQTTMAGTGKTAKEVEKELKKLDEYADKTVYSTADMLNNLPKFTNAGVELETATTAMVGIANATALAGGDANKASIAFYNLGQAIGTGYLTRMDYNSINNAGIATMEWKQQMVDAAIAAGTLTKKGDNLYASGKKTYTLQQLFIDGLQTQWATTDVMLKVFGDYGDETTAIGKKAYAAAQDIKTFSMMMDSLKATAGTGWKDTWQLIFGDLEQAKVFWTSLTNTISGIITKMADWRNMFLGGALNTGSVWETITGKIENSGLGKIAKVAETVKGATKNLKYFQDVVNKVWRGDYNNHGDNPDRFDLLNKAGYDHRVVQDLVNKGYQYKLTMKDVEESHKKFGLTMDKTSESTKQTSKSVGQLTDEQLKNAGLTEEEISLYKALQKEADKLGISIDDLVKEMSENDGRTLLIDSFKNVWSGISGIFKAIGQAWKEIFNPGGVGEFSVKLYGLIAALNNFTKKLRMTDETSDKLKRTFKGIFAIINIITTLLGGAFKIAFSIVKEVLGMFNIDILDATAYIGDLLVKFRDWIQNNSFIAKGITLVASMVVSLVKTVRNLIDAFMELPLVQKVINGIKSAFKNAASIGEDLISGIILGLQNGTLTVWDAIKKLGSGIIEAIKSILGIHSPSTVMMAIGGFIIAGLVLGLRNGADSIWDVISNIGSGIKDLFGGVGEIIIDFVKNIDWGAVVVIAAGAGIIAVIYKLANALDALASPFAGFGDLLSECGDAVKRFSKGISLYLKAQAIKAIAISLAILVGSVIALTFVDPGKLWASIGALAALAGILIGLSYALSKIDGIGGKAGEKGGLGKLSLMLLGLAGSILIISLAIKMLAGTDITNGVIAITLIGGLVVGLMAATKLLTTNDKQIEKIGGIFLKLSLAMYIMARVIKTLGKMDTDSLTKGIIGIAALGGLTVGLIAATKLLANNDKQIEKIGSSMLKLSLAFVLMAHVVKTLGRLSPGELVTGISVMTLFGGLIVGLMASTKLLKGRGDKQLDGFGKMMLSIAGAFAIMAITMKVIAMLNPEDIVIGLAVITMLSALIVGLMAATNLLAKGKSMPKIGAMLLSIAASILVLSVALALMSLLDPNKLMGATACLAVIMGMFALIANMAKNMKSAAKTINSIAITLGLLVASLVVLTFLDPQKLAIGTLALSAVMGMFALLIGITKLAKNSKDMRKTLLEMALIVAVLGGVIAGLSLLNPTSVITSSAALSTLLITLSGALMILSKTKVKSTSIIAPLLIMSVVVALMGAILWGMSELGIQNAIPNAIALSILLMAICGACAIVSKIPIDPVTAAMGAAALGAFALVITAAIGLIGLLVSLFGLLPDGFVETMKRGFDMLSEVMLGIGKMVGSLISGVGVGLTAGLPAMGDNLSEFMEALGPFLSGAEGIKAESMEGIKSLASAILVLTAANILNGMNSFMSFLTGGSSLSEFGEEIAGLGPPLASFASSVDGINPDSVKAAADAIKALAQAAQEIPNTGGLLADLVGDNDIGEFGAKLPGLGLAISQFAGYLTDFDEKHINNVKCAAEGIKSLAQAAQEIPNTGGLLADIVGDNDIADFGAKLPLLGLAISEFAGHLTEFEEKHITNVKCAAEGIKALALASQEIPNTGGMLAMLVGDNDLGEFGAKLVLLGEGVASFANAVADLTEEQIENVKIGAQAVKELALAAQLMPNEGGWIEKIVGVTTAEGLKEKLVALGEGVSSFASSVSELTADQAGVVKNAAMAVKDLSLAAALMPKDGGWVQKIIGTTSTEGLKTKLIALGEGISGFASTIGTLNEDQMATIKTAVDALKIIVDAANNIPSDCDWCDLLFGNNDMDTFATKMKPLAQGIKDFAGTLGTFDDDKIKTVEAACDALKVVVEVANSIPSDCDWADALFGDNDMDTFGAQLESFGTSIKNFAANLGTFGKDKIATIQCAMDALKILSSAGVADKWENIGKLGAVLTKYVAPGIKEFVNTVAGIQAANITSATNNLKSLKTEISSLAAIDSGKIKSFSDSLKKVGTEGIKGFVSAFSGEAALKQIETAATKVINTFANKVKAETSTTAITNAFKATFTKVATAIKGTGKGSIYQQFIGAGKDLANGLIKGMNDKQTEVYNAGFALGQKAVQGEKDGQKSKSPSKLTIQAGKWLGEGLIIGMYQMGKAVYAAGSDLGSTASNTITSAVSRISDVINSDIDTQPTIRPVLDLSNISDGVGAIDGMFGLTPSVGVLSNVRSINSMMANRQNGNDEVVSAIKDLKKTVGAKSGDTYQIGGITYDDGSAVSDAVSALVRAARIERRT